jgi:hypothetical protein
MLLYQPRWLSSLMRGMPAVFNTGLEARKKEKSGKSARPAVVEDSLLRFNRMRRIQKGPRKA